ncbi:hypothetical protein [Caldimonas thermodepolymerans]|uniref:hypothetical protein n=1 Tax=Caldimonas thermodepolymerans TaxID=215580 RepID=UPI00223672C5|nr:hypothetical protein [Caldimonas thermodepolymerans]UZG45582.1 hypothetical protein ONZ46_06430 [Caldimonas thermodepolymerans]
MPVLTLGYRHCDRKRPLFIKNSEIEGIAVLVRQQLVDAATDAIPLAVLSDISGLKINGVVFDLFVGTGDVVHDEDGNPVLGICEYDPGVPDTAMVSVSPVGEHASEELVLSTLGHEIGHAIFDAPGWIVDASKGPGLFDDPSDAARRAYRTTTRDVEHLAKVPAVNEGSATSAASIPGHTPKDLYFAELRANEFMGSLLVPRQRLNLAVEELAPKHGVTIHRSPSLDPELPGQSLHLTADGDLGFFDMECFQRALATRFGVNRRFIEVRMERYGLLRPEAKTR